MKFYKPKSLRSIKTDNSKLPIMFTVCIQRREGEYGGIHGPFSNVIDCLETIGGEGYVILKHCKAGDYIIYKWRDSLDSWQQIHPPKLIKIKD